MPPSIAGMVMDVLIFPPSNELSAAQSCFKVRQLAGRSARELTSATSEWDQQ